MKIGKRGQVVGLVIALLGLGTACTRATDADLVAYVEAVRAGQGGQVSASAAANGDELFSYRADSEGVRDPFVAVAQAPVVPTGPDAARPDPNRRRGPLEAYPLEGLSLVGSLGEGARREAWVRSSDGAMHKVRRGDYMGQNHGKVVAIDRHSIRLRELIADGSGGWVVRTTTVSMVKQE